MLVHGSSTRVSLYSQSLSPRARELTKADEGRSLPLAIGARDIGARAGAQRTKGAAQGGSRGGERAQGRGSGAHRPAPGAAVRPRRGAVGGSSGESAACQAAYALCHCAYATKRVPSNASNHPTPLSSKKKSFSNTNQL